MSDAENRALRLYMDMPVERTWHEMLYVYSQPPFLLLRTPALFFAARPVPTSAPMSAILSDETWPVEECNCWFVYLCAGRLSDVWPLLKPDLPFAGWVRGKTKTLSFYPIRKIRRLNTKAPTS